MLYLQPGRQTNIFISFALLPLCHNYVRLAVTRSRFTNSAPVKRDGNHLNRKNVLNKSVISMESECSYGSIWAHSSLIIVSKGECRSDFVNFKNKLEACNGIH